MKRPLGKREPKDGNEDFDSGSQVSLSEIDAGELEACVRDHMTSKHRAIGLTSAASRKAIPLRRFRSDRFFHLTQGRPKVSSNRNRTDFVESPRANRPAASHISG